MTKTTAARTASGRWPSGPVTTSSTTSTTTQVVSCDSWVRPPEPSTISVLVGLPFTTNDPLKAAMTLAPDSASRSWSSSRRSS